MPNNVAHFHFDADDLPRARRFYETVFGWRFRPWGPPDYFLIETGDEERPGIHGSMAKRAQPLSGREPAGFDITISVADLDAVAKAIEANGGAITMLKSVIHTVGEHLQFRDTEGNVASAMHYFDESHCG
jgi:hypothetical protein